MKNYNERLAEIQLRSQEMIRKREKLRRGIVMTCVPAALCLILFVAPFLPGVAPSGEAPEIGFEMMGASGSNGSAAGVSIWVESKDMSTAYSVQDQAESVTKLLEQITAADEMTVVATGGKEPAAPTQEADGKDSAESKEEADAIVFSVRMQDGSVRRYQLTDTLLQDTDTGKVYPVTAQQARQLKQLLESKEEPK